MRNYKKILSAVLALVLTVSGISVPTEVKAAELTNLAVSVVIPCFVHIPASVAFSFYCKSHITQSL